MDGDGEDRPEDAIVLATRGMEARGRIVFAERRKRLEGIVFRAGYVLYRVLHRCLTGISVRVGHFSVVPFSSLDRLVSMSELWDHDAGAVFKSKLEYDTFALDRGRRYSGQSHMNVTALVNHGLAGIASVQDIVATRILIGSGLAALADAVALLRLAGLSPLTEFSILGWPT